MEFYDVLIIGAGMSAMAAAKSFRTVDSESTVLMISNQPDLPSRKPPLSKQLWNGLPLREIFYNPSKFRIDFWPDVNLERLNFMRKIAYFADGRKVNFSSVLMATGLKPVELPGSSPKAIYFNTLSDFRRLKSRVESGQSVVVVGGGLLSMELASAMKGHGLETTLVIPGQWPLSNYVPKQHGLQMLKLLHASGVKLIRERRLVSLGDALEFDDGSQLQADHYLPSVGQIPSLDFLDLNDSERRAGLEVDKYLRVQGVEGIYASGDIIRCSGYRESFGHEENALRSGSIAGKNLAGAKEAYTPRTFLYSEFLDQRLESVGMGKADQLELAAFEWLNSESKGIALLVDRSRISRITLLNRSFLPETIDKFNSRFLGKTIRGDGEEVMKTILRKYVK